MSAQGLFKALGHQPTTVAVRRRRDWYPTPPDVVRDFLRIEGAAIRQHGCSIWEPAAGDGAMLWPMKEAGFVTVASDIEPQAEGIERLDFLTASSALAPVIVTNPPFGLCSPRCGGAPFVEHALGLGVDYLALLLPANWLWPSRRGEVLKRYPIARVRPISRRIDWDGRGSPSQDHAWHIWDRHHHGPTHLLTGEPGDPVSAGARG